MFGAIYPGQMYPGGAGLLEQADHVLIRLEQIVLTRPYLASVVLTPEPPITSEIEGAFIGYMDTIGYNRPTLRPMLLTRADLIAVTWES